MYSHRSTTGPVDLAFTDRHDGAGGVPGCPDPGPGLDPDGEPDLDLALPGAGPTPADVLARNLAHVVDDFAPGAAVAQMSQVHGDRVVRVPLDDHAGTSTPPACDALVTDRPDVVLVVRVADCVPVLLADPDAGVVGAAHAGRQGVHLGVVERCVEQMRALGARDVQAWVGPHVCGACYEVPAALREEVAAREPAAASTTSWGTPALDLGAAVGAQLARAGVVVHDVARCTLESSDLFSYRRDGVAAGRLAGLVRRRA